MYLLNTLTHVKKSKPVTIFQIKHTTIKYQVSTITRKFQHSSNFNINISIIVITSNISSSTTPKSSSAALQNSQVVLEKHYTNIHNGCWTKIYNWYNTQLHIFHKKWIRLIVCSFNACVVIAEAESFKLPLILQENNQKKKKKESTRNISEHKIKLKQSRG